MNSDKGSAVREGITYQEAESKAMRLCRRLGMERIAWSLRRLHCPIAKDALVLEVGSGGNPYPRANVLLDAYEETRQRHWEPLKIDRPMVLGFMENLPFKSGSFDFLIASHVLEHSAYPEKALKEFQRVARAGYIEVPDAFFERLNPYRDHRAEITLRQGRLRIRKKPCWVLDQDLVELYESKVKPFLKSLIRKKPFIFHVRHYWREKIEFQIINPEVDSLWKPTVNDLSAPHQPRGKRGIRSIFADVLRFLWSQNRRNQKIDLKDLIICPACKSEKLKSELNCFRCETCNTLYNFRNNVLIMCHK